MKIAFAQRKILGRNGASRIIAEQMRIFGNAGHDIFLYCARCNQDAIGEGINIKTFFSLLPGKERRRAAYADGYEKFCRRNGIELSIGNGDTGFQDVLFMHNMLDEEHRLITGEAQFDSPIFRIHKKILSEQKFKVLICNSNMMHDYFKDKYCIDEKRMRVLYPGYDSEIFNTSDIDTCRQLVRKRHGIDRKYVLGFISSGNLVKRGVDILINAMGMLDSGLSKETALLIVGKDDKTDDYKRRIAEVNPDLQIIGAGAVDDIVNYYKTIDILLHPAHIEEFGMTLLEAAACGVPVVTSKKTGFSEVLRGEERDFVMEKPEPTALAEMTTRLLNDDETRKRIGASSAVNATGYSWDKYFSRLYEIYSDFSLLP